MKLKQKIQIFFWKKIAIFIDLRPRRIPKKHIDQPIASTDIISGKEEYKYPEGCVVLYEWDEKGKHWIVFTR